MSEPGEDAALRDAVNEAMPHLPNEAQTHWAVNVMEVLAAYLVVGHMAERGADTAELRDSLIDRITGWVDAMDAQIRAEVYHGQPAVTAADFDGEVILRECDVARIWASRELREMRQGRSD